MLAKGTFHRHRIARIETTRGNGNVQLGLERKKGGGQPIPSLSATLPVFRRRISWSG